MCATITDRMSLPAKMHGQLLYTSESFFSVVLLR